MEGSEGFKDRLTRSGEDAIGKLAQELLENPLVTGALTRAFDAREKAVAAQEVAMGALNIPSAADLERLTRRLRSVSQRLEGLEDGVDRLDARLASLAGSSGLEDGLRRVEERIVALAAEIAQLRDELPSDTAPLPREQERLKIAADAPARRPPARRKSPSS
jgi:septal ring factor EnvC (AmiA/AmiB activator)